MLGAECPSRCMNPPRPGTTEPSGTTRYAPSERERRDRDAAQAVADHHLAMTELTTSSTIALTCRKPHRTPSKSTVQTFRCFRYTNSKISEILFEASWYRSIVKRPGTTCGAERRFRNFSTFYVRINLPAIRVTYLLHGSIMCLMSVVGNLSAPR